MLRFEGQIYTSNGMFGIMLFGGVLSMYHWVSDKEYLKKLKFTCGGLVNELVQTINNSGKLKVQANLVGSGAKGLVTQNADQPIDLDYNLVIINFGDFSVNKLKEYVRKMFNKVLKRKRLNDCKDSTSVLSTEQMNFKEGNKTPFSIDIGIVYKKSDGSWHRLIHKKTGILNNDNYVWNKAPHSMELLKRVKALKSNNLWQEVRDCYLDKKNLYLRRNDHDHPSFICYVEAVNEVYFRHKLKN